MLHLESVPSKNVVPVYTAASSREAVLWWALKEKSKACRVFPVLREWHHPLVSLPKTSLCWMDCESWLLSKPTKSSLKVGFYIFFKWVGGQLALDLSLDGGKFELSYKGFFLFLCLKKRERERGERHTWGFLLTSKIFNQAGMHLALRVVSEPGSHPDSLAGWSWMLFNICDWVSFLVQWGEWRLPLSVAEDLEMISPAQFSPLDSRPHLPTQYPSLGIQQAFAT